MERNQSKALSGGGLGPGMTLATVVFMSIFSAATATAEMSASRVQPEVEFEVQFKHQQESPSKPADSSTTQSPAKPSGSEPQSSSASPTPASPPQTSSGQNQPAPAKRRRRKGKTAPAVADCNSPAAANNAAGEGTAASSPSASGPSTTNPSNTTAGSPGKAPSNCPPAKIVVIHDGGTTEPAIQLTGGAGGGEQESKERSTDQLLASTEDNLKKIGGRQLTSAQQEMVTQIHQFMEQSKAAVAAKDIDRGHNLALKANLLSDELAKP